MSKILELREKRAKAWEAAKKFLDSKRGEDGLLSVEDTAAYEKMEKEVVDLGKEIERLERQAAIDAELNKPTSEPITNKPNNHPDGEEKTGRATDNYRRTFWNAMRRKNFFDVENALQVGTDSEGGYLVPDEFEHTLVEALEEENCFRSLATVIQTSSGDRKIPVVASKGEPESFYADGIEYYIIANNMGYDGDLELALIPESFRTGVLKEEADSNEVLVENAHSETAAFALLFEFDGDIRKIRHVLYNCSASRPKIEGKTNEESREVQTETLTIKARPLASGYVKAKTGNETSAETYANWYKSVYLPEPKAVDAETEGQG